MKMKKSAVIGIFFIVLMLGSTVAYSILSAIRTPQQNESTTLPNTNIIDYELNSKQEDLLLNNGFTVVRYVYNINCIDCLQKKSYLESFASANSKQIFLQELVGNSTVQNDALSVNSLRGYDTLANVTEGNFMDMACDYMLQPPVDCTLRNV